MRIRPVAPDDFDAWLRMRSLLWPDADAAELKAELADFVDAVAGRAVLIAENDAGRICGFIELSLRNVADGCVTSPVGYIEGWFVDIAARKHGIGRALVKAGEDWARSKGCTEMGSDTELDNEASQLAHRALGYEETDRLVAFKRSLR